MKVLVTGGAGFIGSHVVDRLLDENVEVAVVDMSGDNRWENSNVTYYEMNILDSGLRNIIEHEKPDIIYHLAAQISVTRSIADPIADANVNIVGTLRILQCAVKYKVKKIIFASSASVYGKPDYLPIEETHPIQPTSFYGISKSAAETYIRLYRELYGLNYSIFRFSNVYGPRQASDGEAGVISICLNKISENLPFTIYGDGTQTRDFIYVKDVAEACVMASSLSGSHTINVSSGKKVSLNMLIELLAENAGISTIVNYRNKKPGDIAHSCLQNDLARKLLQWKPKYRLEEGLAETYAHINEMRFYTTGN
ncbi:NAD-dependent epimerase/dehydratase family protein [Lentibacillus salinarum]|uniref:NAD-dependent epimerase/dehydratase family protein n=1 Tax=Lentibacillus salinarum TaxID=446820 RepID=A0ABW3ZR05_9BACI